MANTSTSSWYNASNGGSTTLDTEAISGAGENIRILNAEIQWEGKEEDYTYTTIEDYGSRNTLHPTETSYVDTNSDSVTSGTKTETKTVSGSLVSGVGSTSTLTIPDINSEYNVIGDVEFETILYFTHEQNGTDFEAEYENPYGSIIGYTSSDSNEDGAWTSTINQPLGDQAGETRTAEIISDESGEIKIKAKFYFDVLKEVTASTTIPDKTGSTLDEHYTIFTIEELGDPTSARTINYSYDIIHQSGNDVTDSLGSSTSHFGDIPENRVGEEISITIKEPEIKVSVTAKTYSRSITNNKSSYSLSGNGEFVSLSTDLHVENYDGNTSYDYDIDWSDPINSGNASGTIGKNDSSIDLVSNYYGSNDLTQSQIDNGTWEITSNKGHPDMEIDHEIDLNYKVTKTGTRYTQDPSVSGDASGSTGATLTQGERSNWQNLSGLASGNNTFNHSISDMGEAKFRIRFEWDYAFPDKAHGMLGFYDESSNEWKECIVADSSDSKLKYDHVTVYNPSTASWGVLDVVDASENTAISSHQFYDPDAGWVAPRQFSTEAN